MRTINDYSKTGPELSSLFSNIDHHIQYLSELSEQIADCLQSNGKVFLAGNGGSAAMSDHIEGELLGRLHSNRRPLAAVSLSSCPSTITCIANDFSFSEVFSRQIEALGSPGDFFVAYSTSGSSPNVLSALDKALDLDLKCVLFTGKDFRMNYSKANKQPPSYSTIVAPSSNTAHIQVYHLALSHMMCEMIEDHIMLSND